MNPWSGVFTAIITPFTKTGEIDYPTFEKLIERQIAAGVSGLVVLGTTGETPTITGDKEHLEITKWSINLVSGRCKVIIGTSSNDTSESIKYSTYASKCGADAVLQSPPYYNKPSQKGLYEHFKAINDAIDVPILYYEVPSRTAMSIEISTLEKLIANTNTIGIKVANTLKYAQAVLDIAPESFAILSGDDDMTFDLIKAGGHGVVSVVSNIIPQELTIMVQSALNGDLTAAETLHKKYLPLMQAMFYETNPQPVKTSLAAMGFCEEVFRLPMTTMEKGNKTALLSTLNNFSLF